MIADFSDHDQAAISKALENITAASGDSLLNLSIDAAGKDLETTQGDIALIVFTDANEMDDSALESAKALVRQYGERLCIHTVLIGDDPKGKALLEELKEKGLI